MDDNSRENLTDPELASMLLGAIKLKPEYENIKLNDDELDFLLRILHRLINVGLTPEDAVNFLAREDLDESVLDVIGKYYQSYHKIPEDLDQFKNSPEFETLAREFKITMEIVHEILNRLRPELVIFPLRGSEPIKWSIDELRKIEKNDKKGNGQFMSIPLGTTFDIVHDPERRFPEIGVSNIEYPGDVEEAHRIFENEDLWGLLEKTSKDISKWKGSDPPPDRLLKIIRKKRILEDFLGGYLDNLENKNAKIALVDEMVSGGTMSHVILALKMLLIEKGLDGVKINVIAFQHNRYLGNLGRKAGAYHEGIKPKGFDWLEIDETIGDFFTIDQRSFLPAIFLLSEELMGEKVDSDMVSLSPINNKLAEDLIRSMMHVE